MPNFQLSFGTVFRDDHGDLQETDRQFSRVVFVPTEEWAEKVAEAMLGEEVSCSEYLTGPIHVMETSDRPAMNSWDSETSWRRVFSRLYLQGRADPRYFKVGTGTTRDFAGFSLVQ